jgi:hypothetical protein
VPAVPPGRCLRVSGGLDGRESGVGSDPLAKARRTKDLDAARKYIAELEGKVGQQQVELAFFRQALRQVGEPRWPSDGPGVRAAIIEALTSPMQQGKCLAQSTAEGLPKDGKTQ